MLTLLTNAAIGVASFHVPTLKVKGFIAFAFEPSELLPRWGFDRLVVATHHGFFRRVFLCIVGTWVSIMCSLLLSQVHQCFHVRCDGSQVSVLWAGLAVPACLPASGQGNLAAPASLLAYGDTWAGCMTQVRGNSARPDQVPHALAPPPHAAGEHAALACVKNAQ